MDWMNLLRDQEFNTISMQCRRQEYNHVYMIPWQIVNDLLSLIHEWICHNILNKSYVLYIIDMGMKKLLDR